MVVWRVSLFGLICLLGVSIGQSQQSLTTQKELPAAIQLYLPEAPQPDDHESVSRTEIKPSGILFGNSGGLSARSSKPVSARLMDRKFYLLNGLHAGMAVFDVEMTQHCIAERRCRELNSILPSSNVGKLSVNFALVGYGAGASYWLRKHKSKIWWMSPVTGTVAHTFGVITGFTHQ